MAANLSHRRAAFVAALTATDQVPAAERERNAIQSRRDAQSRLKGERYCAWMEATAAYHDAYAANLRLACARMTGAALNGPYEGEHHASCLLLLQAFDRLLPLPLVGSGDAGDRRTLIRRGRGAVGDSPLRITFAESERRWLDHIEADAARLERKA